MWAAALKILYMRAFRHSARKLDEHGFKYIYNETGGGHTWANWRTYLADFAPRLFK